MHLKNKLLTLILIATLIAVTGLLFTYAYGQKAVTEITYVHGWDPVHWHTNWPGVPYGVGFDEGVVECLAWFSKGQLMLYGKMYFVPWLAESWEWKGTDFIIHLRRGVTWTDGTPFTSKDVYCQYMIGKALGWPIWDFVTGIDTPDDYTVVVHCKTRTILAEYFLLYEYGRMTRPYHVYKDIVKLVEAGRLNEAKSKLYAFKPKTHYGTGPYKVVRMTASEAILEKRPDYWKKDILPNLPDRLRIVRFTGNEMVWAMYLADKIDAGWYVMPPSVYEAVRTKPWVYAIYIIGGVEKGTCPFIIPDCSGMAIYFNFIKNKYLLDVRVRKAIMYAIDRSKVPKGYETVFKPVDKPTSVLGPNEKGWIKPEIWEKIPAYEYNPSKAEALLKEAGFTKKGGKWYTPEGKPFKLVLISPAGYTDWTTMFSHVADMLKAFGIEVEFRPIETSAFWGEWIQRPDKYDWDLATGWWGGFNPHPYLGFYRDWIRYFYKEVWPVRAGDAWKSICNKYFRAFEVPGYGKVDPEKIWDEWASTFDVAKQKEFASILAYIVGNYLPIAPLVEKYLTVYASSTRVTWAPKDHWIWYNAPGRCAEMFFFQFFLGLAKVKKPAAPPTAPAPPTIPIEEIVKRVTAAIPVKEISEAIKSGLTELGTRIESAIGKVSTAVESARASAEAAKAAAESASKLARRAFYVSLATLILVIIFGAVTIALVAKRTAPAKPAEKK